MLRPRKPFRPIIHFVVALALITTLYFSGASLLKKTTKVPVWPQPLENRTNLAQDVLDFQAGMLALKNNPQNSAAAIDYIIITVADFIDYVEDPKARLALLNMHKIPERFPNFAFLSLSGPGSYLGAITFNEEHYISVNPNSFIYTDVAIHEFVHFLDNLSQILEFEKKPAQTRFYYKAFYHLDYNVVDKVRRDFFASDGAILDFHQKKRKEDIRKVESIFSPSDDLGDILRFLNHNETEIVLDNGRKYNIYFGHDRDYYSHYNLSSEFIAAYFKFKATNQEDYLAIIRTCFGEDLYKILDDYYYLMLDNFISFFDLD